ncbi:A disintegrin and metalloproteinase with thrombospondin motifs 7 isoform X1 [Tribolium castaneum]|uniref:A disintegrin and metalloproteinase with thrombospondin motifs 7 isoform X1 n=1 Tax=Tribolium castaneum TaxID=7070 RepID=UPI0030FECC58
MFLRLYFVTWVSFALIDLLYRKALVACIPTLNGRYTRDIDNFKLTVPFRTSRGGEFATFQIPSYYKQNFNKKRRKRSLDDPELIQYVVNLDGKQYEAQLWPNHNLISPDAIFEKRRPKLSVQERKIRKIDNDKMCHYTGYIKGEEGSKVALSTCDGLAGYITVREKRYFIEPVQEHAPNAKGQHLHIIYERYPQEGDLRTSQCGTSTNWEDAWRKRFFEKYSRGEFEKRSTESVHRYLETMVVCDKKFLEFHKNIDQETYVLTVMNMVADFYHDSSSGNMMDVVVVRIMYLDKEEEEIDLVINPNADDTLASFCKWQQKINPKDLANPNHHDIAVLLTRYDICADNMSNCGLMGLAYVASACSGNEPCAINEDGGLVLGIVVAHEMGHVMGCAHDKEGESSCPAQDEDKSFFVMAPYVHLYTTRWSTCSRGFITSLFENGLGDCLNDEPQISLYKDKEVLPGVVYDAEQQCKMWMPNSTLCGFGQENICEILLCESKPEECQTKEEPAADGTKCGENKWCYRKKCVQMGQRPQAINGGWGKWSSFSECSRSCGGGVQTATRECDNPVPKHRGRYCIGERKKIKVCNMDPCPPGSPSFREMQCQEHNKIPFQDKLHQWKAFFKEEEPCVLYCINENRVFVKLEPRAKDGTKCKPGTHNMCISGACKKVGCDGEINSEAVEDICGICNGDGTQCKIVDETYTATGGRDYVKVATVPVGSRNVLFEELAPAVNTLAVSDASERRFFLNGGNHEERDGNKMFGETEGIYTHADEREKLFIHGPLTEDIVLFVVFYSNANPGYHYKYAEPSLDTSYVPKYHWEQTDWEECSAKCGGGTQAARWVCVEEKAGKVSDSFCESQGSHSMETRECNTKPCTTKWKVGQWGKCHACKFKSGVRMREVECVRESPHPGADDILVEDGECKETKPGTRELCNSHKKCKSRRFTDGLPDELMEDVWKQIHYVRFTREDKVNSEKEGEKNTCGESGKTSKPVKLNVGQIVKDRIPPTEIKVIEVPLKQSHLSLNLSDTAFETMGDQVGDSIDTSKARIATGKDAVKTLKKLQNGGPEQCTEEQKEKT